MNTDRWAPFSDRELAALEVAISELIDRPPSLDDAPEPDWAPRTAGEDYEMQCEMRLVARARGLTWYAPDDINDRGELIGEAAEGRARYLAPLIEGIRARDRERSDE